MSQSNSTDNTAPDLEWRMRKSLFLGSWNCKPTIGEGPTHFSRKSQIAVDNRVTGHRLPLKFPALSSRQVLHMCHRSLTGRPLQNRGRTWDLVLWPDLEYFQSMFPILKVKGIITLPQPCQKKPKKQKTTKTVECNPQKHKVIKTKGELWQWTVFTDEEPKAYRYESTQVLRGWHRPSTDFSQFFFLPPGSKSRIMFTFLIFQGTAPSLAIAMIHTHRTCGTIYFNCCIDRDA